MLRAPAEIATNNHSMSNNAKANLSSIDTMKRRIKCVREGKNLPARDKQKIVQGDYRIQLQIVRCYAWVHTFRVFIDY